MNPAESHADKECTEYETPASSQCLGSVEPSEPIIDNTTVNIRESKLKPPSFEPRSQSSGIELTKTMDIKSLLSCFENSKIEVIDGLFRNGAYAGLGVYLVLLFIVYRYSSPESYEVPDGSERFAHVVSFLLLLVTNGSRIIPLLLREDSSGLLKSGFIFGTLMVQGIAMSANFLMGFSATPVLIDPITGFRTHLVRWVEWIALAFLMTFFTSNIEASLKPRGKCVTYVYAISLAVSTSAGLLSPFCSDMFTWMLNLIVSVILYLPIYVLLYDRIHRYRSSKKKPILLATADEQESWEIMRTSLVLSCVCSVTWTGLVLFYLAACAGRIFYPSTTDADGFFASTRMISIGMCFFEVASKIWYLSVLIDAYSSVFDENSRVIRRFELLRSFMSALWDSSADAIIFCGQGEGRVNACVSPAFLKMVGLTTARIPFLDRGDVSLILEVIPEKNEYFVFAFDVSKPLVSRQDVEKMKSSLESRRMKLDDIGKSSVAERNVAVVAHLAVKACAKAFSVGSSHTTELVKCSEDGEQVPIRCEVKINTVEDGSSILVLRDISDRIQRFETEKKLLQETAERRKDEETIKFTRHEIKNGILSAIALLTHIKENLSRKYQAGPTGESDGQRDSGVRELTDVIALSSEASSSIVGAGPEIEGEFSELESTLRDVLDTVLDQAMAREIVYGQYKARKERIKVLEVLASLRRTASSRFPLSVRGGTLPDLAFDRQLIRFIYRNAVSNACKYGKHEGLVETNLSYNSETGLFEMVVINAPGDGHDELVKLSPEEVSSVFKPETQLFPNRVVSGAAAQLIRNESSGNGAWIMQKCAESLEGKCSIRFEPSRTVFTFVCRVDAFPATQSCNSRIKDGEFFLPADTWGIAVDDSTIQRKLMDRFLKMAGIQDNRRKILGGTSEEIYSFGDTVAGLMAQYPKDKFILIVDENLDVEGGGVTVSGSLCVEKLRQQLDPETECRLLALIRSANDSLPDINLYISRSHGYLHKEPIQKGKILDVIRPWWKERFSSTSQKPLRRFSHDEADALYGPSADDILESVEMINALVAVTDESVLEKRWSTVREKLFVFKGDLKTMETTESIANVVHRLDRLVDHPSLPGDFLEHWANIKYQVESIL